MVAQTLLIGEGEQFKREREPLTALVQTLDHTKREQYAKRAIVFACVAYRIEMRAKQ